MKRSISKEHSFFVLLTISVIIITTLIIIFFSFRNSHIENIKILQKESKNLETIISESFDYTNQINSHIGQQISQHGAKDLKFILNLFQEADKIKNKNADLFSWSSFDWVDNAGYQTINSRLGLRKKPPNMSARQYVELSPKYPWTLQLSFPTIGNPSNSWVIPAGTGITDKNGKYLGAIVVGFNISELTAKINQKLNQKTSFVVLDKDLRLILKSNDIDLSEDSDFFKNNFDQKDFNKTSDKLNKKILVGDIEFLFYNNFSKYPYIVLMGFDKNFISGKFINLILPRILEIILLTLFFLLILYIFKTKIYSLLKIEKTLRKSLQIANQYKDNLLNNLLFSISHDIKNYVFGIKGLAKMVLENKQKQNKELSTEQTKAATDEEDLQNLETICEQAEELGYFVEDLLDQNQIEGGGLGLGQLKPVEIKSLINSLLLINKRLINEHKVIVKTNIEPNLPKLLCDPRRMKQILLNLITNAIKYNKPGGEVLITANTQPHFLTRSNHSPLEGELKLRSDFGEGSKIESQRNFQTSDPSPNDKAVRPSLKGRVISPSSQVTYCAIHQIYIEISDQGFGMNEEEIKKYLSGNGGEIDKSAIAQVKEIDSHGIGMSIVLRLVELHHGRIEVESKKGIGTKIKLYFKLDETTESISNNTNLEKIKTIADPQIQFLQSNSIEAKFKQSSKKNKFILLVDDNPVNRKVTSRILENDGYEISYAENGLEALEIIDQEKNFDLILMDGEMPIMDGYKTTKAIRQGINGQNESFKNFKNYKTIPIIALMGSSNPETIAMTKEIGMNDYIEKSNLGMILGVVEKWV